VHSIWCQLLEAIRDDEDLTSRKERTRVVYEWCTPHPLTGTALQLDFTFIPVEIAHLNWAQYSGGIDLKANPQNPPSSGSANTLGRSSRGLFTSGQSVSFADYTQAVRKMSLFGQDTSVQWCAY